MVVIKLTLAVTGTAAFGLLFGSNAPTMKPGPEPYWARMVPYSASDQGEDYSLTEAMPHHLSPPDPFRLFAYPSSDQRYAALQPVYVPIEPVEPAEVIEIDAEPLVAEPTEADESAEAEREVAAEVRARLRLSSIGDGDLSDAVEDAGADYGSREMPGG